VLLPVVDLRDIRMHSNALLRDTDL